MTIEQHRNKEILGGVVNLLTIDASPVTGNPSHIRRYVDSYGTDGTGVIYQGNVFLRHPYKVKKVKRSAKFNKSGVKISIANNKNFSFSSFMDDLGSELNGARIYEYKVYERFLDSGAEPNPLAYAKRLDHKVNYTEESNKEGEMIIHTLDPLSRDIQAPSIAFSAGIPNDTTYHINVFPAANRSITEGR